MMRSKTLASTRSQLLRTTTLAGGALAAMCLMAAPAHADVPQGGVVVSNSGGDTITIGTANGPAPGNGDEIMTIALGDNESSVIEWTDFDIGGDDAVNFTVTFSAEGAVLNRVTGLTSSVIDGDLNAPDNLHVYLINPNGILFGSGANVNVGGLIASTLDLESLTDVDNTNDYDDFMANAAAGGPLRFVAVGAGITGVTVQGAGGGDPAPAINTAGPLVLLGGVIDTSGTLDAGGDIALAAASDITMTVASGSPLAMTINEGTAVTGTVIDAGGTIEGNNVYLAMASRAGVLNALLSVTGTVTANSAVATDRGIVLAAGVNAGGITVDGAGDTTGAAAVALGGTLTANESAGAATANVEIRARGNVTGAGTINAADVVTISSNTGNVTLTSTDAIDAGDGITVNAAAGTIGIRDASTADGDISFTANAITLNLTTLTATDGNVTLTGPITLSGDSTVTAGDAVTFGGTINGTNDLTVSSDTGTSFNGTVGATTALANLDVTGAATLNASTIRANGDIDLDGLTVAFGGPVSLVADANSMNGGDLVVTGAIVGSGGGIDLSLSGESIQVANVGVGVGASFNSVDFNNNTTLTGNVVADTAVTFDAGLTVSGAGVRRITAASASFQGVNAASAGSTGLSVITTGATTFNSAVGATTALSSLGVNAATATFTGTNRVGTLAVNVDSGGINFTNGQAMTIGTVDGIVGVDADAGDVSVTTTGASSDITINTSVTADTGNVALWSSRNFLGSGSVTAGIDVGILAGGSVATGAVSASDDIVIRSTGATATGALTSGTGADVAGAGDTLAGAALTGGDVDVVANGIRTGAVVANGVGSDIRLNGGATGVGHGSEDLSLDADGNISISGAARGRDIALNAGGTILTGSLTARDDVVVRAVGSTTLGAVTSGVTVSALTATDADGVADDLLPLADLTGQDIDLAGNGLVLGAVDANGSGSDVRLDGGAGGIGHGSQDLNVSADGDIDLAQDARGWDVALVAGGDIDGFAITARDDIAVLADGTVTAGNITLGATVDGLLPIDAVGAVDALLPEDAGFDESGQDLLLSAADLVGVTYTLTGIDDFALTDTAGGLNIASDITVGGTLSLTAVDGNLTIGAVTLTATDGDINLTTAGTVSPGDIEMAGTTLNVSQDESDKYNVTLISVGDINQDNASSITTYRLRGESEGVTRLFGNNDFVKFSFDAKGGLGVFEADGFDSDEAISSEGVIEIVSGAHINIQHNLTAGGDILLEAATDITLNAAISGDDLTFISTGGAINQTGGSITGATLTGSAFGSATLTDPDNDIDSLLAFSANGFFFVDEDGLAIDGIVNGAAGGVDIEAGGDLLVNADVLASNAPITLSAVGGNSDLTLDAAVNAGTGTVTLEAGATISQTAGIVTAGLLTGSAGGSADLTAGINQITNLGPFSADGFALLDGGGLTIVGVVDGGSGGVDITSSGNILVNALVESTDGPISLDTASSGSIDIAADIDAGGGTVTLLAQGAGNTIAQNALTPGVITAGSLTGESGGATTLNLAANHVAALGPFSSTGFTLLNDVELTVSGDVDARTGGLAITVVGESLLVNGDLTADTDLTGDSTVLVATGVGQGAASVIDAGAGTILIDANDGAIAMLGTMVTDNATAAAVMIIDSTDAALGAITTGAGGTVTLGGALGDSLNGDVSQNGAIITGTLTGNVTGTATLLDEGNEIATLGAFTAGSLLLSDNEGGLLINGDLTIDDELELNSTGVIDQTAGIITAGSISGSSVGGASFDSPGNVVEGLGEFTNTGGGGFTLVTTVGLTMTGDFDAGTGDLSLTAVGIDFTGQTITAGGDIGLAAGTGDLLGGTVNAGGSFTGSGQLVNIAAATATAGGITLTSNSDLGLGTGNAGGSINLAASGTISSNTLTAGGSIFGGAGAIIINSAGAGGNIGLSAGGDIFLGGGGAGGDIDLSAGDLLEAGSLVAGGDITGFGGVIDIDTADAQGDIALDAEVDLTLDSGDAGGAIDLISGGMLTAGDLTAGAGINGSAFLDLSVDSADAGDAINLTAGDDLSVGTADAGDAINLTAGNILTATSLVAGSGINGSAGASIDIGSADANGGSLNLSADTDLTIDTGDASGDINLAAVGAITGGGLTAGGSINASGGSIGLGGAGAGGDINLAAGGSISAGTLDAGGDISGTGGSIDIDAADAGGAISLTSDGDLQLGAGDAGDDITLTAAGALTGGAMTAGGAITGTGATIDLESAEANGGDLSLTSEGDLALGGGGASGAVTLEAAGALSGGDIEAGADFTGTGTSIDLASATAGGALSLTTEGDLTLGGGAAGTTATLIGAMVTLGGFDGGTTLSIEAEDLDIDGAVSASESVDITNAGTGVTGLGSDSEGGFNLAEAEINNISTPTLTIQSVANAIAIGDLAFATGAGSDRVNLLTSGRIDVTGTVTAEGSTTSREFQVGGTDADTGESSVIRVAATSEGGGRLLMDQAVLHLRGAKIGVGQDAEFLTAIGLVEGGTPLGVDQVAQDFVADAQSTLYVPATPYDFNNNVLVSASSMTVTYGDYALFQNTSFPGTIPGGVVIGSAEAQGTLTLNSSGSNADNAFSMSGEINGRRGVEAAVLGPNFIIINDVNLNNSRLNGCLVGSGGNCIINIVATPFFQFFDESRADVLSTGRDLTLTLDPLVGANNEALFSGISSVDDPAEDECPPDAETPCPAEEGNDQ